MSNLIATAYAAGGVELQCGTLTCHTCATLKLFSQIFNWLFVIIGIVAIVIIVINALNYFKPNKSNLDLAKKKLTKFGTIFITALIIWAIAQAFIHWKSGSPQKSWWYVECNPEIVSSINLPTEKPEELLDSLNNGGALSAVLPVNTTKEELLKLLKELPEGASLSMKIESGNSLQTLVTFKKEKGQIKIIGTPKSDKGTRSSSFWINEAHAETITDSLSSVLSSIFGSSNTEDIDNLLGDSTASNLINTLTGATNTPSAISDWLNLIGNGINTYSQLPPLVSSSSSLINDWIESVGGSINDLTGLPSMATDSISLINSWVSFLNNPLNTFSVLPFLISDSTSSVNNWINFISGAYDSFSDYSSLVNDSDSLLGSWLSFFDNAFNVFSTADDLINNFTGISVEDTLDGFTSISTDELNDLFSNGDISGITSYLVGLINQQNKIIAVLTKNSPFYKLFHGSSNDNDNDNSNSNSNSNDNENENENDNDNDNDNTDVTNSCISSGGTWYGFGRGFYYGNSMICGADYKNHHGGHGSYDSYNTDSSARAIYHLNNSVANDSSTECESDCDLTNNGSVAFSDKTPTARSYYSAGPFGSGKSLSSNALFDESASAGVLEGWFYVTDLSSPATQYLWYLKSASSGQDTYLSVNSSGALSLVTNGTIAFASANGAVSANKWHYVSVRWSGSSTYGQRIYVNGVLVAKNTDTGYPAQSANGFYLGNNSATGTESYFNGYIDEVRFYTSDRSDSQIARDSKAKGIFNSSNDNLVGLWHLDEESGDGAYLLDSSGNENNGTPGGTTHVNGKIDGAREFNGSSDYIATSKSLPDMTAATFEAWIKPTSLDSSRSEIIFEGDTNNSHDSSLGINSNGAVFYTDKSGDALSSSSGIIKVNKWYHIVGTNTATEKYLYVNEDLVASSSGNYNHTGYHYNLQIGRGYDGGGAFNESYFKGIIDEVRISNTSRTADELDEISDNCKCPPNSCLKGNKCVPFDYGKFKLPYDKCYENSYVEESYFGWVRCLTSELDTNCEKSGGTWEELTSAPDSSTAYLNLSCKDGSEVFYTKFAGNSSSLYYCKCSDSQCIENETATCIGRSAPAKKTVSQSRCEESGGSWENIDCSESQTLCDGSATASSCTDEEYRCVCPEGQCLTAVGGRCMKNPGATDTQRKKNCENTGGTWQEFDDQCQINQNRCIFKGLDVTCPANMIYKKPVWGCECPDGHCVSQTSRCISDSANSNDNSE